MHIALEGAQAVDANVRVVSMPCWDLFETQDADYIESVLPAGVPTVSIEAGITFGWSRWARESIGIDRYGASAPAPRVLEELGITAVAVTEALTRQLS